MGNTLVPCPAKCWEAHPEPIADRVRWAGFDGNMLPLRYKTFANLKPRPEATGFEDAVAAAVALAQGTSKFHFLILSSIHWPVINPIGTGVSKTHIALASLNLWLDNGGVGYFTTVESMLDTVKDGYSMAKVDRFERLPHEDLLEWVSRVPFLVLDDFGAEYKGRQVEGISWAETKILEVINQRSIGNLKTVITTNTEPRHIERRIGSRITDWQIAKVIGIKARDYRSAA